MAYAKSEKTQEQLVKTMSRLLRSQGYHATGVGQILSESEVPRGSLYHHFPGGKVELAATAVNYSGQNIMTALHNIVANSGSPTDTLILFCEFYIQEMQNGRYIKGCPLATVTLEAAATIDPIQTECQQAFANITQLFTQQLEDHGVAPETAVNLATVAVASIEGALILSRANRDTRPLEIVRDNLMSQLQAVIPPQE